MYEVAAWLILLLHSDSLTEKGEEADTKTKIKSAPKQTPQKPGRSFKKSQSPVCFSFYRPPSKFTQSELYYKEWINTERFSKADLLELSLILKAECLFSLIWGSAPVQTAVKGASITRSRLLLSHTAVIVEWFLPGNFEAGPHPFMLKSYLLQGLLEDIMFPSASYFLHSWTWTPDLNFSLVMTEHWPSTE